MIILISHLTFSPSLRLLVQGWLLVRAFPPLLSVLVVIDLLQKIVDTSLGYRIDNSLSSNKKWVRLMKYLESVRSYIMKGSWKQNFMQSSHGLTVLWHSRKLWELRKTKWVLKTFSCGSQPGVILLLFLS